MKLTSISYNFPKKYITNASPTTSLYYSLVLLHNTEVRGFRILFGKPVNGQKTNCNAQTSKRVSHPLYTFKYKHLAQLSGKSITKPIFIAEYINLFWQHQWISEWVPSYKSLKSLPFYLRKTNFIDIANINRFHIYHQYNNPFQKNLKKQQKRKKVIPKNKFATGLPFGFSIIYKTQLESIIT